MAPPLLALLPSPLLGPAVWAHVANALGGRGWETAVPPLASTADTGERVTQTYLDGLPDDRDLVLVPHSNAGLYVPLLADRRRVAGQVFVDAGIPPPGGEVPLAPEPFYAFLSGLADDDGVLPPWTRWWDEDPSALFPTDEVRRAVEAEARRLPLSYFGEELPVPAGWDSAPSAYLAFGDAYAEERQRAMDLGWPVRSLSGGHLHMLFEPDEVAGVLTELLSELGFS